MELPDTSLCRLLVWIIGYVILILQDKLPTRDWGLLKVMPGSLGLIAVSIGCGLFYPIFFVLKYEMIWCII